MKTNVDLEKIEALVPGLREKLADLEHERWSKWMRYLFSRCKQGGSIIIHNGQKDAVIPGHAVTRWSRQMETPYSELSEKEKDMDRAEADKTLRAIEPLIDRLSTAGK